MIAVALTPIAQIIGVSIVAAIGFVALFVSANRFHWCAYGREIIAWFGVYQLCFAVTRLLRLYEFVSPDTAFAINTMTAGVFLSILVNLVVMHWMWHRAGLADPAEHGGRT